jgi:hypothetical protein
MSLSKQHPSPVGARPQSWASIRTLSRTRDLFWASSLATASSQGALGIGGIKIAGDEYVAFDADGKKLGRFADQTSAAFAIVAAAERSGGGV